MLTPPGTPTDSAHIVAQAHFADAGIEPPAALTYATNVHRELFAAANLDPTAVALAAIERGDDPAKVAAAVTKAATARSAADAVNQTRIDLGRHLDRLARQALHDHGDAIIGQLAPLFDQTVAAIRDSNETLGAAPPTADMLRRPAIKALWDTAAAARRRLDAIHQLRDDLAECAYGPRHEDASWYVTTAADLSGAPPRLVDLIAGGVPLRLNTAAEVAAVAADRDRVAAEEQARRAERKQRDADSDPMVRAFRDAAERDRRRFEENEALRRAALQQGTTAPDAA